MEIRMKALIIQPAFLGDAILSLALTEELRRLSPPSHISYLVRPEAAPVMRLSPSVDKVFSYDKYDSESGLSGLKRKAAELNAEGFDLIFTLHSSKRTRMLLEKLDAPEKIGYGNYNVLTRKVQELHEPQTSRSIRLLLSIFPEANLNTLPKLQPLMGVLPDAVSQLP